MEHKWSHAHSRLLIFQGRHLRRSSFRLWQFALYPSSLRPSEMTMQTPGPGSWHFQLFTMAICLEIALKASCIGCGLDCVVVQLFLGARKPHHDTH